jgi:Tfp pilus assembly protein PilP
MRFVKTLAFGTMLAAAAPGLYAQAKPASSTATKPATPAAAKPADQAAAKPATQSPAKPAAPSASTTQNKPAASGANKPAAKPAAPTASAKPAAQAAKPSTPAAKPAPKKTAKKTAKPAKPAASAASATPAADKEPRVAKRDPFESMVGREHGGGGPVANLPSGKAGLQVSTLRLDGIVRAPNGMIAVVSNPQSRTYFLREGDQLYDGRVEKIAMDGVSFHEVGKDAFGKPVERQVSKRIYASAGEQQ